MVTLLSERHITPTILKRRSPVPSYLEIAQEAELKPIALLAEELGLLPEELELYGAYKAKVKLEVLDRLKGRTGWQVHRCDRDHANPAW